jgi:NAD(P)-dependent dehydrogenase (short-subunit alcohol dehydrogenase family)
MNRSFTDPDLRGRTALVTGGGTGIGRAVALALAARGADVWITGRRAAPLEDCAAHYASNDDDREALGGLIRWRVIDATDSEATEALAKEIRSDHGSLHILVNNAAILGPTGPLSDIDPSEVEAVWDINIHGLYSTTAIMLPLLRAASAEGLAGACVINLSSGVGRQGRAGWGPYAASKFAVEGLTQCWADELATEGIAVNALNPGATATTMRAEAKPAEDPATLPRPEDVVPAFLFLLSSEAADRGVSGLSIDARDFSLPEGGVSQP